MEESTFEDALKKLESIVQKLEEGQLSLNESLAAFEEGIRLSNYCAKKLEEAQNKVEILLKDREGKMRVEKFEIENNQ